MLNGLLVGALTAALLSTAAMFVTRPRTLPAGVLMWSKRLALALVGTAVVAAASGAAAYLLTSDRLVAEVTAVAVAAASLLWLPVTRRWNARAHLCWSSNTLLYVTYLVFMLEWTFDSPLGTAARVGALLLWALEVFAGLLGVAYLWELCDALGSELWRRRSRAGVRPEGPAPAGDGTVPFVSLHVPAHEEPPELVIATLESLLELDYPAYEVIAIDDNTTDEALWRPVERWCAEHGVTFAHLENHPGYKSGALNHALEDLTDDRAEVIGVVDSDYQIDQDFLARCAPLFADQKLGFVQTPQDYREWKGGAFQRRLYYSYQYFFTVSQPSRNERDGAIFAGTMGLIRRSALEGLGGWDEWCITEDAELSLRLLRAGWSGLHVDASFGHGVMPLSFEALKGQRFRWCFGGIQILRMHWRSLLPGRRRPRNRLTAGQRWAYFSGGIQWYGDLVGVLFFLFLLGGAANIALGGGLLFRQLSAFLVAAIPLLVVLGFVRAVALIRRGTGASWSDAIGAFFIWQSTTLVVARASVQALFAKEAEFLRTPKDEDGVHWWRIIWANKAEVVLAVLGLVGIGIGLAEVDTFAGALTAGLLVLPTLAFLSAPWNSLVAQRSRIPADLAAKRVLDARRDQTRRTSVAAGLGLASVAAAVALVLGLLGTTDEDVQPPSLRPEPGAPATSEPGEDPTGREDGGTESPTEAPSEPPTDSPTDTSTTSSPTTTTSTTTSSPTSSPTSTTSSPTSTTTSSSPAAADSSSTSTTPSPTP